MIKDEDELLKRRIDDIIQLNAVRFKPAFLGFLDERQVFVAHEYLDYIKNDSYVFYGGFEGCVRAFVGVDVYGEIPLDKFPVKMLSFKYRKTDKLTHRDFLGALMGLGIKRESVGDIVVGEGTAHVFVDESVAPFIIENMTKVGRVGVKVFWRSAENIVVEQRFENISCTVASLRLDCIVNAITSLSREKTKQLILSKDVTLNYQTCTDISKTVESGDKISVRGKGKYILDTIGGVSKKGRRHITIKHFL